MYETDLAHKITDRPRWDELMPWNWTADSAPVSMAA